MRICQTTFLRDRDRRAGVGVFGAGGGRGRAMDNFVSERETQNTQLNTSPSVIGPAHTERANQLGAVWT